MSLFISFEGPDGSGKTTITNYVTDYFKEKGLDVMYTREPGGIGISETIRNLILDPKHTEMDNRTEALLYAASRRQHLVEKVIPALEAGQIVFCDRFIDSSLAYQGYARGIGIDNVWDINAFAIESHLPNLTIFLDCNPEVGLQRAGIRGEKDRLELEGEAFHQKVYDGYQEVIRRFPDRIKVIDGQRTIDEVAQDAIALIERLIQNEQSK